MPAKARKTVSSSKDATFTVPGMKVATGTRSLTCSRTGCTP